MNITGLTAGTTYAFTVRAGDANNNWSAQSIAKYCCAMSMFWGLRRYFRLALERPTWCPERHGEYPPLFREAARQLLLCAHRGIDRLAYDAERAEACGCAPGPGPLGSSGLGADLGWKTAMVVVEQMAKLPLSTWL